MYSKVFLDSLPTPSVGQADDLKLETEYRRVWLSRMTTDDTATYDNQVTVESLYAGRWVTVETYKAR